MPFFYFLYFELLSLLVALYFIKRLRGSYLILFVPFLILTNVQEWGSYFGYLAINGTNTLSLNIFNLIEFLFYSYIFYINTNSITIRRRIIFLAGALVIIILFNYLFIQGAGVFLSYSYLIGSLIMVSYVFMFYYNLFEQDKFIILPKYPLFWISIGVLFFYLGMFVYYAFFELLTVEYFIKNIVLFSLLMNIFNIILYTSFIIAFVCQKLKSNII